jgi:hypothetical protein
MRCSLLLVLPALASIVAAQEQCSTAIPFSEGTYSGILGNTLDGPPVSCGTMNRDIWGFYTPSCTGIAIVSTSAVEGGFASVSMIAAAYTGTCGSLTEITCTYPNGGVFYLDYGTRISFPVTSGVPVYVRLGGNDYGPAPGTGAFTVVISCHPLPANDECGGAPTIGEGLTIGWTDGATTSAGNAPTCGAIFDDTWYLYVPSCTGNAVASLCPYDGGDANFGAELVAYAGTCSAGLTPIACAKQTPGSCGPRASFPVIALGPVLIRIGGLSAGHHGAFRLAVSCGPAPPNDTCANPITLQVGLNGPFSNVGASDDYPPVGPSACTYIGQATWSPGYSDVWFSWTATCGAAVRIAICPTPNAFVPFMEVRLACGPGGSPACIGSCQAFPNGATLNVTAGTNFLFRVGAVHGVGWYPGVVVAEGQFTIELTCVWALKMTSPFGPGSISMQSFSGTPLNNYFTAVTAGPMLGPPNFYGIYIPMAELLSEWNWPGGFPFRGTLDLAGDSPPFVIPVGVPAGLLIQAVSLDLDPVTGAVVQATVPVLNFPTQ